MIGRGLKRMLMTATLLVAMMAIDGEGQIGARDQKKEGKCPMVRPRRNLKLKQMEGFWYVISYYSSNEEAEIYKCMRAVCTVDEKPTESTQKGTTSLSPPTSVGETGRRKKPGEKEEGTKNNRLTAEFNMEVALNFSYIYSSDPDNDVLQGNITWIVPKKDRAAHWVHKEKAYQDIYNTYVLAADYDKWSLLLHCADKAGNRTSMYLSSFLMSRTPDVDPEAERYLKGKLKRYGVDLEYMFNVNQTDCMQVPTGGAV